MIFLSNTRFYLLQIKGKKDTTVIFIERQNISLGQRINSKLIFRLQLADIRREKEGLNGGGGGPLVGCRLKFSYFVGSRLKFSIFVGCRLLALRYGMLLIMI